MGSLGFGRYPTPQRTLLFADTSRGIYTEGASKCSPHGDLVSRLGRQPASCAVLHNVGRDTVFGQVAVHPVAEGQQPQSTRPQSLYN